MKYEIETINKTIGKQRKGFGNKSLKSGIV